MGERVVSKVGGRLCTVKVRAELGGEELAAGDIIYEVGIGGRKCAGRGWDLARETSSSSLHFLLSARRDATCVHFTFLFLLAAIAPDCFRHECHVAVVERDRFGAVGGDFLIDLSCPDRWGGGGGGSNEPRFLGTRELEIMTRNRGVFLVTMIRTILKFIS